MEWKQICAVAAICLGGCGEGTTPADEEERTGSSRQRGPSEEQGPPAPGTPPWSTPEPEFFPRRGETQPNDDERWPEAHSRECARAPEPERLGTPRVLRRRGKETGPRVGPGTGGPRPSRAPSAPQDAELEVVQELAPPVTVQATFQAPVHLTNVFAGPAPQGATLIEDTESPQDALRRALWAFEKSTGVVGFGKPPQFRLED